MDRWSLPCPGEEFNIQQTQMSPFIPLLIQAEKEMDPELWTLMKEGVPGTPTREDWLSSELQPGSAVGVDPFLVTMPEWTRISSKLQDNDIRLQPLAENLVDKVHVLKRSQLGLVFYRLSSWSPRSGRESSPSIQRIQ